MSRIYDALRKAEEEKQSPTEELQRPYPAVGNASVNASDVERSIAAPYAAAPSVAAWNPLLKKLPALVGSDAGAEEFRRLRSRIYQLRDANPLKSLLVTSGLPGEGKSFIASNLAVSLARHHDCRVLLIDGDLRRPTLHSVLGAPNAPGLSDYLAGRASAGQIVQQGNISNLVFIPAGTSTENAAELAGNNQIEELMGLLRTQYDWIIVDSSPVVPVSDAVNLAHACEGVLLVARAGATPFDVAQRLQREFRSSRVLGFVLNAVPAPKSGNAYAEYANKYRQALPSPKAQAAGVE